MENKQMEVNSVVTHSSLLQKRRMLIAVLMIVIVLSVISEIDFDNYQRRRRFRVVSYRPRNMVGVLTI
jgi:hypothetical protein